MPHRNVRNFWGEEWECGCGRGKWVSDCNCVLGHIRVLHMRAFSVLALTCFSPRSSRSAPSFLPIILEMTSGHAETAEHVGKLWYTVIGGPVEDRGVYEHRRYACRTSRLLWLNSLTELYQTSRNSSWAIWKACPHSGDMRFKGRC